MDHIHNGTSKKNETEFMMKIINHIGNKLDLPVRETLSISPYDENTIPAVSEEICADLMNRYSLIRACSH